MQSFSFSEEKFLIYDKTRLLEKQMLPLDNLEESNGRFLITEFYFNNISNCHLIVNNVKIMQKNQYHPHHIIL